ncbi:conserved protein of unknown function [Streptococcus thermophilus]|uniref:Uncharacterized protein n=2 Tax=Streptococcus thermophilus TaxID=1308 RepID=A0A8D6UCV0_STRTR|nr:conserved protein of unknown function [Streptococcus thermophilus]
MAVTVMFRITNLQTRQQETCANRDELLSVINEKSVWAEDRNELITLQLEQVAEDGEVLDNMSLSLPLQEIVEEALSNFGLKREKKGFSLLQRKPQASVSAEEVTQKTEDELVEPISAPKIEKEEAPAPKKDLVKPTEKPKKEKKAQKVSKPKQAVAPKEPKTQKAPGGNILTSGLIWKVLAVGALGLSLASFAILQKQAKTIKVLEDRMTLEENQGQVEVVGRFFIANYYSGSDDNLKDFLSKNLKAEGVPAQKDKQVQSTIYESVSKTKDTINVTFVVTTKGKDDTIKTVRLTLPFKEDKKSKYGYVLVGQPKFSSFAE